MAEQDLEQLAESARKAAEALNLISQQQNRSMAANTKAIQNSTATFSAFGQQQQINLKGSKNLTAVNNKLAKAGTSAQAELQKFGQFLAKSTAQVYRGEKAGTQFANVIDSAGNALAFFASVFMPGGVLIKGLTFLAIQFAKMFGREAVENAQLLYDSYLELGKTGAGTAGSLAELARNAQQFGFGMEQLDQFANLINMNAKTMALFGKTVQSGQRSFGQFVEPLLYGSAGAALMNMGISADQIREGTAGFIKLQSRLGLSQSMTIDQLTKGSYEYLTNLNELSRLTGATIDEQEKAIQAALSEQRFRAAIEAAQGDPAEEARMRRALAISRELEARGASELAQGFRDMVSGFVGSSEAAQKFARTVSLSGDALTDMDPSSAVRAIADSAGAFNEQFTTIAQAGRFDDVATSFVQTADLLASLQKGTLADAEAERKAAAGRQGDVAAFTEAFQKLQLEARNSLQNFINNGLGLATKSLRGFSSAVKSVSSLLGEGRPLDFSEAEQVMISKGLTPAQALQDDDYNAAVQRDRERKNLQSTFERFLREADDAMRNQANPSRVSGMDDMGGPATPITDEMRMQARQDAIKKLIDHYGAASTGIDLGAINALADKLGFQYGGIATGPDTGYSAVLHGTEAVVPLPDGKTIPVTTSGTSSMAQEQMDMMQAQLNRLDEMVRLLGKNNSLTQGLGAALQ